MKRALIVLPALLLSLLFVTPAYATPGHACVTDPNYNVKICVDAPSGNTVVDTYYNLSSGTTHHVDLYVNDDTTLAGFTQVACPGNPYTVTPGSGVSCNTSPEHKGHSYNGEFYKTGDGEEDQTPDVTGQ